ncbi:glycosyltransferase [Microbacterium pumilum]|uniref:Glycosyltransferase n=1 Tax=Microbacterium pumilum TaxID=344165 RepID=A0ABN2RVR3_9MICO
MTRFGFVSTYPPTRCGLATFTVSLARAVADPREAPPSIVRVIDADEDWRTSPQEVGRVVAAIRADDLASHRTAARALDGCDVVIVQHEFGIYGGEDGAQVIGILEALRVPAIVVLHTVLPTPSVNQRRILERVAGLAAAVVVMTDHALETLSANYAVDPARVHLIPHGVAYAPGHAPHHRGTVRRILTWGLLSPGKGLERGIRALALLRMRGVSAEYVIAGQTHPKVRAHSGESYRESLAGLGRALGVDDSVVFVDRYLTDDDIAALLASADAVLLPYESHEQATSGVLVEAVSAGVPVVATAFPHAVELLGDDDGLGVAVRHDDLAGMADGLEAIFTAPGTKEGPGSRPRGRVGLTWAQVAARYAELSARLHAVKAA